MFALKHKNDSQPQNIPLTEYQPTFIPNSTHAHEDIVERGDFIIAAQNPISQRQM
jgi:hypothetical protein